MNSRTSQFLASQLKEITTSYMYIVHWTLNSISWVHSFYEWFGFSWQLNIPVQVLNPRNQFACVLLSCDIVPKPIRKLKTVVKRRCDNIVHQTEILVTRFDYSGLWKACVTKGLKMTFSQSPANFFINEQLRSGIQGKFLKTLNKNLIQMKIRN